MQLAIQRGGASSALRKAGHLAGLKITAVLGWLRFLAMGVWVSAAPPGGWGEGGGERAALGILATSGRAAGSSVAGSADC